MNRAHTFQLQLHSCSVCARFMRVSNEHVRDPAKSDELVNGNHAWGALTFLLSNNHIAMCA
jgi:hypothetical protein